MGGKDPNVTNVITLGEGVRYGASYIGFSTVNHPGLGGVSFGSIDPIDFMDSDMTGHFGAPLDIQAIYNFSTSGDIWVVVDFYPSPEEYKGVDEGYTDLYLVRMDNKIGVRFGVYTGNVASISAGIKQTLFSNFDLETSNTAIDLYFKTTPPPFEWENISVWG